MAGPDPVPLQIAIIGASGDIATPEELNLAGHCGRDLAARGCVVLTAGDDGVMGAAARAVAAAGGTVVAVLPRDKRLSDPALFCAVVDTGLSWVQFGDSLIRSSSGALIIGGGAGTLAELALLYLAQMPAAFVGARSDLAQQYGNKPLDRRELGSFPVFDEPSAAVDHVVQRARRRA